jgi:lysophospholipase L1-like esterase
MDAPAPARMPSKARHIFLRIILVVFSVLLSLAIVELVARVMVPDNAPVRFEQDIKALRRSPFLPLAGVLERDDDLFWKFKPNQKLPENAWPFKGVISNSQGFREDHFIPLEKPKGEFRILFLGDSCTFGYGLDYTDSFPNQAEMMLSKGLKGRHVECINSGVPGYTIFQGYQNFLKWGSVLKPDWVVVCYGWNDILTWDGVSDLQHYEWRRSITPKGIFKNSGICRLILRVVNGPPPQQQSNRPRVSPNEYLMLLKNLKEAATLRGSRLMILSWPMRHDVDPSNLSGPSEIEAMLNDFTRNTKTVFVSATTTLRDVARQKGLSYLYVDPGHATASGNQIIARMIANKILDISAQPQN